MDTNSQENNVTKITITFPTNAYFISGLRDFTLNIVKNTTNFSEKWAFRFQSIIDELCNNAIEHGSAPGADIRVTFYHKKEDYLEIVVEDTGTGKTPLKAEDMKKVYSERTEPGYVFSGIRGRGLAKIVGEWTDELDFEDRPNGGLKVRIKKFLNDPRFDSGLKKNKENLILSN